MSAYLHHLFADIGLWTAIGVTLVAGLMRGFAGFGSAMLMAPIFAILFGSAEMVVTVVAIELVVSLQLFPQVRGHADWKTLMPMSIAACAAMPLGVWLLASVDKGTIVTAVSAVIGTVIDFAVSPSPKCTRPEAAVKSCPPTAVPLAVVKARLTGPVRPPLRST